MAELGGSASSQLISFQRLKTAEIENVGLILAQRSFSAHSRAYASAIPKLITFSDPGTKQDFPMFHGWVFDARTGNLKNLNLDMQKEISEIRNIYDLKPLESNR